MINNSAADETERFDPARLDRLFSALSDPTRRGMIVRLSKGSATIGELGAPYDITKGAVTKHVKVLERSGLLKREVQGRVHRCELDTEPLDVARAWVEEVEAYWNARFDDLSAYLDEVQGRRGG